MLRLPFAVGIVFAPWSRRHRPQNNRGLPGDVRPDNHTLDGVPLLFPYYASLIVPLVSWVVVVAVLHP